MTVTDRCKDVCHIVVEKNWNTELLSTKSRSKEERNVKKMPKRGHKEEEKEIQHREGLETNQRDSKTCEVRMPLRTLQRSSTEALLGRGTVVVTVNGDDKWVLTPVTVMGKEEVTVKAKVRVTVTECPEDELAADG